MTGGFPEALKLSFADTINRWVDWLALHYGDHLRSVSERLLSRWPWSSTASARPMAAHGTEP